MVSRKPPSLFVRLLPSQPLEDVNNASLEFSEGFHRVHRMAKGSQTGCTVVSQVALDSGPVWDVHLVSEAFDVQEGKHAACIEYQSRRNKETDRSCSRHFNAFQNGTNPDANVLPRHVLSLRTGVKKGTKNIIRFKLTSLMRPAVTRRESAVACQKVRKTAATRE